MLREAYNQRWARSIAKSRQRRAGVICSIELVVCVFVLEALHGQWRRLNASSHARRRSPLHYTLTAYRITSISSAKRRTRRRVSRDATNARWPDVYVSMCLLMRAMCVVFCWYRIINIRKACHHHASPHSAVRMAFAIRNFELLELGGSATRPPSRTHTPRILNDLFLCCLMPVKGFCSAPAPEMTRNLSAMMMILCRLYI